MGTHPSRSRQIIPFAQDQPYTVGQQLAWFGFFSATAEKIKLERGRKKIYEINFDTDELDCMFMFLRISHDF